MTSSTVEFALASMRTGEILRADEAADESAQLHELAATLPEIFGTVDPSCLRAIATRLGADGDSGRFVEVVLLSESRVHVIAPLKSRPSEALLTIGSAGRSVGMILSQAHARAARAEEEP